MSHITFTYHMSNAAEVAETCITLPMTKAAADTIMGYEPEKILWDTIDLPVMQVFATLNTIALLQGYDFVGIVAMERVD